MNHSEDYGHESFVDRKKIFNKGEDLLKTTYSTTLNSMNTAFGLATALAWNEAIKSIILKVLPKYEHNSLLIYAFIITIIYAIFLMLTKRNAEEINVLMAKMA